MNPNPSQPVDPQAALASRASQGRLTDNQLVASRMPWRPISACKSAPAVGARRGRLAGW